MTAHSQMLLSILLLARLPLYLQDKSITFLQCSILTLVSVAALSVFELQAWVVIYAVLFVLINLADYFVEKRDHWIYLGRCIPGTVYVLLCLLLASPNLNVQIRPFLADPLTKWIQVWIGTGTFSTLHVARLLLYLNGLLIALHEANLLIRYIIEAFSLRPDPVGVLEPGIVQPTDEYARGRVIGGLERIIIFFLITQAEFAAIGLILAAKGLARFEELKDKEFSEYFLVGTLLSICLSGFIGIGVRWLVSL